MKINKRKTLVVGIIFLIYDVGMFARIGHTIWTCEWLSALINLIFILTMMMIQGMVLKFMDASFWDE